MSQPCAISSCKRPSCALCHCCQQNICLFHLNEHQNLLVSELNPLVDQINVLGDRLKAFNVESIIGDARQKLEEWRDECHQKIDDVFKQKYRELKRLATSKIDKQREEISRIQSKTSEFLREQHTTRHDLDQLTSTISDLEREMNKLEETSFDIRNQSLEIDDRWITIEELGQHRLNLSNLGTIYRTMKYDNESWKVLTNNDHVLVMHQKPYLCFVDRHLKVIEQIRWNHDCIYDMCYSSALDQFFIITSENVFLLDQNTMSIEEFPINQKQKWLRGTCSNQSLFLSTYEFSSSIIEYNLLPSIKFTKHWKPPITCQKNEFISYMNSNNQTLALIITEPLNKTVRMELKDSKAFTQIWSLPLNETKLSTLLMFTCCSFNDDEWLISTYETQSLLHISNQGQLKTSYKYQSKPFCVTMFTSNLLALSTDNELYFHKLF